MQKYVDKIVPIEMLKERRMQHQEKCTASDLKAYQALAGRLNMFGHGILPQAALAASYLQKAVGRLKVSDLTNGNKLLAEIKGLSPILLLGTPSFLLNPSNLDSSHSRHGSSSYGKTGYVSGLYLPAGLRGSTMSSTGSVPTRNALPFHPRGQRFSPPQRHPTDAH